MILRYALSRQSQSRKGFINSEVLAIGLLSVLSICLYIALLHLQVLSMIYNTLSHASLSELILRYDSRQSQNRKGFIYEEVLDIGLLSVLSICLYIALLHPGFSSLYIYNTYLSHP